MQPVGFYVMDALGTEVLHFVPCRSTMFDDLVQDKGADDPSQPSIGSMSMFCVACQPIVTILGQQVNIFSTHHSGTRCEIVDFCHVTVSK